MTTPPEPLPTARLEPEITIAVCPPAQFGSHHIKAADVWELFDTAAAKWSATPPKVIPLIVAGVVGLNDPTQTIRQLPAVVDGIVGDRLLADVVWTTVIAIYATTRKRTSSLPGRLK
jgi:hypothetical protein